MITRWRARAALAGAALVAGAPWMLSRAGAGPAYEGVAAADGVRVGVLAPGASLMDQVVELAGPTTQALVDSFGNSRAFSSNPYPGELIVTTPGTLAALGPPQIPHLPDYPFLAQSSWPTAPESEARYGSYVLTAESEELMSKASAIAGAATEDPVITSTQASVETRRAPDGTVTSQAVSLVEGVRAGPLAIAEVRAHAKVTRPPGGAPQRESGLAVTGLSVGGQSLGLTDDGLTLAGSIIPLPASDPVRDKLAQAGISIELLRGESNPSGVVAPVVRVTMSQEVPGFGEVTVTYLFGRASAHALAGPLRLESPGIKVESPPSGAQAAPAGSFAAPGGPEVAGGQFTAPPASVASAQDSSDVGALSAGGRRPLASPASAYVALAVAGAVALGAFQLVRILGVRSGWTS